MKKTTAWAIAWVAVALGVSVGIYITGSAWCLWAFLVPAFVDVEKVLEEEYD